MTQNKFLFGCVFIMFFSLFSHYCNGQIKKNIDLKTYDIEFNTITRNGIQYDYVQLKNARRQQTIGTPDLPVFYYTFYIPVNQKAVSVVFKSNRKEIIQLTNDLIPTQKPFLTSWNGSDTTFILPNKLVYGSNDAYPKVQARITETNYLDGDLELVTIEVFPMQYNPISKTIDYSSKFDLKIETVADDNADGKKLHPKKRMREVLNILKSIAENTEMVSSDSNAIVIKSPDSSKKAIAKVGASITSILPYYEYVIITDASLVNGFTDFLKWKKQKGIDIGIVTTNDIYANYTGDLISNPNFNDNAGKVRQYLKDAHANGGPTKWALFAGDYNTNVPIRIKYDPDDPWRVFYFPTDAYFCDLSNNWADGYYPKSLPDIFVGRLICSNTTDIINWTKKVLLYEQNPGKGDYSYLLKSFSIEADQLQSGKEADGVNNHFPTFSPKVWGEKPSYYATYNTDGYSGTTLGTTKGADVIREMNNHYGLFGWFCHGGTGGKSSGIGTMASGVHGKPYWKLEAEDANSYHDVQQEVNNGLDNLNNADYPSILYSNSCDVTPFDITSNNNNSGARNCGEAFTVLPQTGGVAFLGNTKYGLTPGSNYINQDFGDFIYKDDFSSHIGVADYNSKQKSSNRRLFYTHNLIGCPETQIWTSLPINFSNATIVTNGTSITVNSGNVSNCKICIMSASDNGHSFFEVHDNVSSYTFSNVPESFYVTITKHNYIPYMYLSDCYIQNETYSGIQTINAYNVAVGSNVTTSKPSGPVTIQTGANVTININGEMNITDNFEVQSGAQFEIKK